MKPRRYQLNKDAAAIIARGHPWIFRDQLSTAAAVFGDGDWLRLVDGQNRVVAHGIFEAEGAIAIRILRRGVERPDAAFFGRQLATAIGKRAPLASRTDAIRLLHGESDGIPAVVVDRFADTIVASSYSAGADALVHHVARVLAREGRAGSSDASAIVGPATHVVVRSAHRRRGTASSPTLRVLCGAPPPTVRIVEDGVDFVVDLAEGQKTGTYLDLRGLRRAIATAPLQGARVLNLFAYSGMLGKVAELAGAAHVTQVDVSQTALALAAARHVVDPAKHDLVVADVFDWLPARAATAPFDLVIVDPPAMTSKQSQVKGVLAAYRRLYGAAAAHVRPGGALVAACCTSRIERAAFHEVVRTSLGDGFTLEREIAPEIDHPVGFPQADYLKIGWWRRAGDAA